MRALPALAAAALVLALLPSCTCTQSCCAPCPAACCPGTFVDVPTAEPEKEPEPKPFATRGEKTTWEYLAGKYDADGDGAVSPEEHGRGEKAFKNLDQNGDGKVTASDFERADRMQQFVAQVTVARYFQTDDNPRDLKQSELESAFAEHDTDGDGSLTAAEFEAAREKVDADSTSPVPPMPEGVDPLKSLHAVVDADGSKSLTLAEMKAHFASRDGDGDGVWKMRPPRRGGLAGLFPTGPAPGEAAPDFTLEPPGGGEPVTLSRFEGKKPVALIFGSYT